MSENLLGRLAALSGVEEIHVRHGQLVLVGADPVMSAADEDELAALVARLSRGGGDDE